MTRLGAALVLALAAALPAAPPLPPVVDGLKVALEGGKLTLDLKVLRPEKGTALHGIHASTKLATGAALRDVPIPTLVEGLLADCTVRLAKAIKVGKPDATDVELRVQAGRYTLSGQGAAKFLVRGRAELDHAAQVLKIKVESVRWGLLSFPASVIANHLEQHQRPGLRYAPPWVLVDLPAQLGAGE